MARGEARRCLVRSAKLARCVRGFARRRYAVIFFTVVRRQRANRLERDVFGAQFSDQISGLLERHVAHGPIAPASASSRSPRDGWVLVAIRSAECMSGCRGCDVACVEKKHERITARAIQVVADFISMLARFLLNSPSLSRSPNEKALGNKEQL